VIPRYTGVDADGSQIGSRSFHEVLRAINGLTCDLGQVITV
jgi:hypothetical protein